MKLNLFILLLGFILGFSAHLYLAGDRSGHALALKFGSDEIKQLGFFERISMLDEMKLLQDENTNLKSALIERDKLLSASKITEQKPIDSSESRIRNNLLIEFKAVQAATDFARYLAISGADYQVGLDNKFKTEDVDLSWVGQYEEKINKLFSENNTLSDFVPELIECKSTMCKIRINVANNEDSNRVMELFSKALVNNEFGITGTNVISAPELSKGIVNLYVGKNDDVKLF